MKLGPPTLTVIAKQQFCLVVLVNVNGGHEVDLAGLDLEQLQCVAVLLCDQVILILVADADVVVTARTVNKCH